MDAKEEIESLKQRIEWEEEEIEGFNEAIANLLKKCEIGNKRLLKFKERLAAELSQVSA